MKVDIGGGLAVRPGYINLDPVHGEGEWKRWAQDGIPVPDNSLDTVLASHVMEHIPAGEDRVFVMNEVWRALKPGGRFEIIVPLFPFWQAIADPTHVSFWVRESFWYFTGEYGPQADYGLKPWREVYWSVVADWEGHWIGEKYE